MPLVSGGIFFDHKESSNLILISFLRDIFQHQ